MNISISKKLKTADNLRNLKGNLSGSLDILQTALEQTTNDVEKIEILERIAVLKRDLGDIEQSETAYNEILEICKDDLKRADILRSLSYLYILKGDYGIANKKAQEALKIAQPIKKNEQILASIYAVLGNIQYHEQEYEGALENYEKALEYAKVSNFEIRIITLLGDISNVYMKIGKTKEVVKLITDTIKMADSKYSMSVPTLYIRLGYAYENIGDMENSVKSIEKGIKIAIKQKWVKDIAEGYEALADVIKKQNPKLSKEYYKKAIEIFNRVGYTKRIVGIKEKMKG